MFIKNISHLDDPIKMFPHRHYILGYKRSRGSRGCSKQNFFKNLKPLWMSPSGRVHLDVSHLADSHSAVQRSRAVAKNRTLAYACAAGRKRRSYKQTVVNNGQVHGVMTSWSVNKAFFSALNPRREAYWIGRRQLIELCSPEEERLQKTLLLAMILCTLGGHF